MADWLDSGFDGEEEKQGVHLPHRLTYQMTLFSHEILRECSTRHGEGLYGVGFCFRRLDFSYPRWGGLT